MIGWPELIIILIAVIFLAIILIKYITQPSKRVEVKIGSTVVKAEVADTFAKQVKGLMFHQNLKENEGMLFIFGKEAHYEIWMMNMSFPIDIIWINNGKVVDIKKDAQPCLLSCESYRPKDLAKYVLEVNSNFTDRHNVKIGTKVELGQIVSS